MAALLAKAPYAQLLLVRQAVENLEVHGMARAGEIKLGKYIGTFILCHPYMESCAPRMDSSWWRSGACACS